MKTIQSILLSPYKNLLHAFSTREDGNSMLGNNLAYHVNDKTADVDKNQNELAQRLGYSFKQLIHMNQVHGNTIEIIDAPLQTGAIPTCDALMTNEKNRPLMVMVADCIPVLIYDPVKEAVAAVHAGRAGILSEIIPKSIEKMQITYGTDPADLLVVLGPSIHQCCYEVGEEIKKETEALGYGYAVHTDKGRHYLDLLSIANVQLKDSGVSAGKVEVSEYCTACNTDIFYSYRAEKQCGRFAGIIMLRD